MYTFDTSPPARCQKACLYLLHLITALTQHVCISSKDSSSKPTVGVIQAFRTLLYGGCGWQPPLSYEWYMKQHAKLLFLGNTQQQDVKTCGPWRASSLTCIVSHLCIRPYISAHHITEIRIRSGISGNTPRHMHTQEKPFGISVKNGPSKKTSSIQMSPQISRESMTTSAEVADEETHTYTPLPPIVLLGHSSN